MLIRKLAKTVLGGAVTAVLFSALPALAHHGWSGNTAGDISITGVLVEKLELSGPHGTMKIRDSEGQLWSIT